MAAKVKDGLFVGDSESAADQDFLELNKISNLANFACAEVPNVWSSHGLVYQSYPWEDRPDYDLFALSAPSSFDSDGNHKVVLGIIQFIDSSIAHGISVMAFSRRGTGRAIAALCAYFMGKYGWGIEKALDYLFAKKPDMSLNKGFVQQLRALETLLLAARRSFLARVGVDVNDETVLTHEKMRRVGWDSAYLQPPYRSLLVARIALPHRRALQAGGRAPSLAEINRHYDLFFVHNDADAADELLCLNSQNNSLLTLRALPGPYPNSYDKIKSFKIRFHHQIQRDAPPSSPTPRRGSVRGILRTSARPGRGSTEDAARAGARGRAAWGEEAAPPAAPAGASSSSARSRDDDSVTSDLSSADPFSSPQSANHSYHDYCEDDREEARRRELLSSDDLYGFVGMDSAVKQTSKLVTDSSADEKRYYGGPAASKGDLYSSSKQSSSYSPYDGGSKAPSLYDLANMHIAASFRPPPTGLRSGTGSDPLAAFDLPGSGPVRVRHDIVTSRTRSAPAENTYARQQSAASIASASKSVISQSSRRSEDSSRAGSASSASRKKSAGSRGGSSAAGSTGNSWGDTARARAREAERRAAEDPFSGKMRKWR